MNRHISLLRLKPVIHRAKCYYTTAKKTVRIGCASGFWGDTPTATPQLLKVHPLSIYILLRWRDNSSLHFCQGGRLNYLIYDYLSELTMSLLTASKQKNPSLGYAPDFISVLVPQLAEIKKQGETIFTVNCCLIFYTDISSQV